MHCILWQCLTRFNSVLCEKMPKHSLENAVEKEWIIQLSHRNSKGNIAKKFWLFSNLSVRR